MNRPNWPGKPGAAPSAAGSRVTGSRPPAGPQCRLLALPRQPLVDSLVSALQGAVDRHGRRFERGGGFAGREAEHVAEYQPGALPRGRVLEGRDEGELDAFELFITGLGAGRAAAGLQPLVG